MIDTQTAVRSQLIPIEGDNLILPNTAIAEVIFYVEPEAISTAPEWVLGRLDWRDRSIPLISFELACEQAKPARDPRSKIVVINTIGGNPEINFFAIVTQGLPQLLLIDESKIAPIEHEIEASPLILGRVIVNGEPAIIPNLDALENMLLACKKSWAKHVQKIDA
ncbi:MAG: chemotaxis protein CheW [Gammaproteobacteria bacterium]